MTSKASNTPHKPSDFLLFSSKRIRKESRTDIGKIATSLSNQIWQPKARSLFDSPETVQRDAEIMEAIRREDERQCIDRQGKPIFLSAMQLRIIYALSYGLSLMPQSEEIAEVIERPYSKTQITRPVNIGELAKFLFGRNTPYYRKQIIAELFKIASIRQCIIIEQGGKRFRITSPLLNIGNTIEDLSPEEQSNLDTVEVVFGGWFFEGLNNRFAILKPILFEEWAKGGRQTLLYAMLLNNLLSIYWQFLHAADMAEKRIRKENKGLPASELQELIREEREKALTYEIDVDNLKSRIITKYDSNRETRKRFNNDFENAVAGYRACGLIESGKIVSGARGQKKIVIVFSTRYRDETGRDARTLLG